MNVVYLRLYASHQLPQDLVKDLSLHEIFRVDTPDEKIRSITKSFPSLTSLSFYAYFTKALLFDPVNLAKIVSEPLTEVLRT